MVTRASRRLATAILAGAVLLPATQVIGAVAFADPSPDPAVGLVAPPDEPDAPATQPSIGTWIIGGTELEGTSAIPVSKPAVKPAVKPVAKPAAKPATAPVTVVAPRTVRTHRATTTRAAGTRTAGTRASVPATGGSGIGTAVAVDGATALPFTGGGHVDTALPTGIALLLTGLGLTFVTRPRRTATA